MYFSAYLPTTIQLFNPRGYGCIAEDGYVQDSLIYCDDPVNSIAFYCGESFPLCSLQIGNGLYLNDRWLTGAVKLYDEAFTFRFDYRGGGLYNIYNIDESDYMWFKEDYEPYITSYGAADNWAAWWEVRVNGFGPIYKSTQIIGANDENMIAEPGLSKDALVSCEPGNTLTLTEMGPSTHTLYRAATDLFLSYNYVGCSSPIILGDPKDWKIIYVGPVGNQILGANGYMYLDTDDSVQIGCGTVPGANLWTFTRL